VGRHLFLNSNQIQNLQPHKDTLEVSHQSSSVLMSRYCKEGSASRSFRTGIDNSSTFTNLVEKKDELMSQKTLKRGVGRAPLVPLSNKPRALHNTTNYMCWHGKSWTHAAANRIPHISTKRLGYHTASASASASGQPALPAPQREGAASLKIW
jgi:hypothetical protein